MMTGYKVHQHGVWAFADPELRHGQSHVRNIRDAGYRTGVVGKLTFGATVLGTQASINKKCKTGVLSTPEKLLDHPSHY